MPPSGTPAQTARAAAAALGADASQSDRRRAYKRAYHAARRAEGLARYVPAPERRVAGGGPAVVRRGPEPRLTPEKIADALVKTGGLLGISAQLLHCARRTLERRVSRSASLQEVRRQAKEHAVDDAEWALFRAAKKGEPWAVQWFLKYQAKDRGYQDVRKSETDNRLHVEVSYSDEALRPAATVTALPTGTPTFEVVEAELTPPGEPAPDEGTDG